MTTPPPGAGEQQPRSGESPKKSASGTWCFVGSAHAIWGGTIKVCPGARDHNVTVGLGVGIGASVGIDKMPPPESSTPRAAAQASAGVPGAQAGAEAGVDANGHNGEAGASAETAPIGPHVGFTFSGRRFHWDYGVTKNLADDRRRSTSKGRTKFGLDASLDIEFPLPDPSARCTGGDASCVYTVGGKPMPLFFVAPL